MEETVFEKIIKKEVPAYVIYEDEETLAFLDVNPLCEGHTLVIPKTKYVSFFDIPEGELKSLVVTCKKVANILKEKLGADGVNVLHASEVAAQQTVPHFHFHIIPRKEGDGLDLWPKVEHEKIDILETYEKLK